MIGAESFPARRWREHGSALGSPDSAQEEVSRRQKKALGGVQRRSAGREDGAERDPNIHPLTLVRPRDQGTGPAMSVPLLFLRYIHF